MSENHSSILDAARTLYQRRWLVYELAARDLKLKYRGSTMGFAWSLLNPLLFMAVYALVFGVYLHLGIRNYPVFLLSGIMSWNWFINAVQAGTSSIVDGRMYVGKTVFPTEVLVIVPVLSNCMSFIFSIPFLIAVVYLFHQRIGSPILFLPLLILAQVLLTSGLLYFLATLNVFFRDLQHLVQIVLMLLFFLVPIFYSMNQVPVSARPIIAANPIALIIMGYQDIFYYNTVPRLESIGYVLALSLVLLASGYAVFARYAEVFGEYV